MIARLNLGGPARCVIRLAHGLEAHGFETRVAAGCTGPGELDVGGGLAAGDSHHSEDIHQLAGGVYKLTGGVHKLDDRPSPGPLFETPACRAAASNVLETVPELKREISPLSDMRALFHLIRSMRAYQPHIVHTHTAKAGFLGRLAACRVRPRPVMVHTFHGHVLDSYFGPVRSMIYRHMEREMARRSQALIAVSPSVREELVQRHGVAPDEKFHVIPSGYPELALDQAKSLREELGLADKALVGGVVGRLVPIKGIDLLLQAIPVLIEKVPGFRLLLAGDGPLRAKVESHAARSLWKQVLIPLGNRLDMADLYKSLDFLILPSLKEGLPTVLLEAVQAGVPIVASRIPGVTDLFEHEKNCLLFEPGSVRSLTETVARLALDEGLRHELAARAGRTIPSRVPDYQAVALAHARLYNDLLKQRAP